MVETSKHSPDASLSGGRRNRKPLQLLSGIFGRKTRRDNEEAADSDDNSTENNGRNGQSESTVNIVWGSQEDQSLCGDSALTFADEILIPEPREALHSPYHAKTIDQDMEHLRLSRQDNPYLQVSKSEFNFDQFSLVSLSKIKKPNRVEPMYCMITKKYKFSLYKYWSHLDLDWSPMSFPTVEAFPKLSMLSAEK
jgi:hypothetical protein